MEVYLHKRTVLLLAVFLFSFRMILCLETKVTSNNSHDTARNHTSEVPKQLPIRKIWQNQEKSLKSFVSVIIKKSMPTVLREIYTRNVSTTCMSSLMQLTTALKQAKLWAFKMLDASGKLPIGFLSGTLTTLGNYDECVGINIDQRNLKIQGQYCLIDVIPPLPKWRPFMSLHLPVAELKNVSSPDSVITYITNFAHNFYVTSIKAGLCIPSACSTDDAEKLVHIVPEMINISWKFTVNRCETRESFQFSQVQIDIMIVFIVLAALVTIATIIDLLIEMEKPENGDVKGKIFQILMCFSLRLNMKSVSNYMGPHENLRFVYGVTTIATFWFIAANAFMTLNYDTLANVMDAIRMTQNVWYEILMNRITPTQTLFFFGAFMTAYKWTLSKNHSVWRYLLKAYWRYTPTYMFLIGLMMLTPGWGSGPSWMNNLSSVYTNCRKNWWTNLLYINNYVNSEEMCLEHSWFFAVAAQLHVLGLLVLIPLKKCPKVGLLLNLLLAALSLVTVFLTNMYYNILPNETMTFADSRDQIYYAVRSYHRVYTHAVFYCAGLFVGYFAATKPNTKISHKMSLFFWVSAILGALASVCLAHLWSDGNLPSSALGATYAAFSKLLWAAFLSWATWSCVIERKGVFFDIMSWRPFIFCSRLTFIVFVINPIIVTMVLSFKRVHVFITEFEVYYSLSSMIVCNYVPAYILHVGLESVLQKLTAVLKQMFRIKTFNRSSLSENGIVNFQCEEVVTEKLPKANLQNLTKEKNLMDNFTEKSKF